MNTLIVLCFAFAAAVAAPAGVHHVLPANTAPLSYAAPAPLQYAAPAPLQYAAPAHAVQIAAPAHVQLAAPVHAVQYAAPAVAHVSVPLTKTVHYANTPVVTGYSSTVYKPPTPIAPPLPALPHPVAYTPVVAEAIPVASVHSSSDTDVVIADAPAPVEIEAPVVVEAPIAIEAPAVNYEQVAVAAPVVTYEQVAVASPVVHHSNFNLNIPAPIPAGDAPPFDQLVRQEQVLAPGRTVTHITPQITQVVPEVRIEKVVHDVPVAQPIIAQAPPITYQAVQAVPSHVGFAHHGYAVNTLGLAGHVNTHGLGHVNTHGLGHVNAYSYGYPHQQLIPHH